MMKLLFAICISSSLLLVVLGAGMTPEQEACGDMIMPKLAAEPDAALRKHMVDSIKLAKSGKIDEIIRLYGTLSEAQKDRLNNYYFVDVCEPMKKEFTPQ